MIERQIVKAGLFDGIGGFDIAADAMGWHTEFHCEINPFCNHILKHYWPHAKNFKNITTSDFTSYRGRIDVLTGGGSPANPCRSPETEKEPTITVTSGLKCAALSTRPGPLGYLVKTLLASSVWRINPMFQKMYSLGWTVETLPVYKSSTTMRRYTFNKKECCSTTSLKTLKKSGIPSKHLLYRLRQYKHPTNGTERGLLPTPLVMDTNTNLEKTEKRRAKIKAMKINGNGFGETLGEMAMKGMLPTPNTMDHLPPKEGEKMQKMVETHRKGRTSPSNLREYMNPESWEPFEMLPTPKVGGEEGYDTRMKRQGHNKATTHLESFVEYHLNQGMLPTIQAQEGGKITGKENQDSMTKRVRKATGQPFQLNPLFVAEMMGFPPNWTVLPFQNGDGKASKPTATP